jgi:hypothetical protein
MHEVHTHVIGVPEVCCIEGWLPVLHSTQLRHRMLHGATCIESVRTMCIYQEQSTSDKEILSPT